MQAAGSFKATYKHKDMVHKFMLHKTSVTYKNVLEIVAIAVPYSEQWHISGWCKHGEHDIGQ